MSLNKFLISIALLAPTAAYAAINEQGDEGGGGGGGTSEPAGPPVWRKNYTKSDGLDVKGWGAGYSISGGVWAQPAHDAYKDRLGLRASADTHVKLAGRKHTLFRVMATGSTEARKKTTATLNGYVGGLNIYSRTWTSQTSVIAQMNEAKEWLDREFLDIRVPVSFMGFGVSFRARAVGKLGATLTGKLSNVGAEAAAAPYGGASLYLTAAVGDVYCALGQCIGAQAGVYSDVNLFRVTVPASVGAWWSLAPAGGVKINFKAKANATIKSLDGEAGVYARACLPIAGCKNGELELFDWNGITKTFAIANHEGWYCLAGTCN